MKELCLTESAYAKINLHLEVLDRRPDGYHSIDTVMQTVSLADDVTVRVRADGKGEMRLTCSLAGIPTDESNIACRVARAFLSAIGRVRDSIEIHIEKKIPVAAGLGGGSADGAAVLRALNRLYEYPLTKEALCALATPLGADIPFCILGGCKRAEGIGEIFTEAPSMEPSLTLVIAMGRMGSNTARAYAKIDAQARRGDFRSASTMIDALQTADAGQICAALFNRFEEVILPENKDASCARRLLRIAGAKGSLMSGSGASVFGIFSDDAKAEMAVELLQKSDYFAVTAKPIEQIE